MYAMWEMPFDHGHPRNKRYIVEIRYFDMNIELGLSALAHYGEELLISAGSVTRGFVLP
jgi:hypothetical protein